MISSINNNISALNAFGTGLSVRANNIANSNSENFKKSRATYVEGENGEVNVEITKVDDNLISSINSDNSEENISEAQPSNVDLTEEIPGMIIDQRGYEANLKAIKTKDEILGTVLDIIA